ncbi:MAG: Zn-dependent hydrolase [Pseudomonadota bacterium]
MSVETLAPAVDMDVLHGRLDALVAINPLPPDGACRLALTAEDRAGRDQFAAWAQAAGLALSVDAVGNMFASLHGARPDLEPVMSGSHLDTVATGGRFDGALGVVAALGVAEAMKASGKTLPRGLVVAAFTNEEGARFQPDMLGSLVHVGGLSVSEARDTVGVDGICLGDALDEIGYAGPMPPGAITPSAFIELHVEQGPILDAEGLTIGVVEGVQGISWQEVTFEGEANHAGATPMRLRQDAGRAALALGDTLNALTAQIDGLLATAGRIVMVPNLINVIPQRATITVDLRHPDDAALQKAEDCVGALAREAAQAAGVSHATRQLARFSPVPFDAGLQERIALAAEARGLPMRRLISGAGHDAQMLARTSKSAMIFAPSIDGISHNPAEATHREDIEKAVSVLGDVLWDLCCEESD